MPAQKIHSCKPLQATLTPMLAREYFFLQPKKNFFHPYYFCFFSPPHTGYVLNRTDCVSNVNRIGESVCGLDTTHHRTDSRASGNKVLPKAGVTSFYDTFVLNRTLVFQINSSAKTPRLRQYPKRYLRFIKSYSKYGTI